MTLSFFMREDAVVDELRKETRSERMEQRVKPVMKEAIELAAILSGTDTSEFVTRAAFEAALEKIRSSRFVSLNASDAARFCAALDAPSPPTEALKELMAEHDAYVSE
jgi:uncharacterized protein (DUF1778 family)